METKNKIMFLLATIFLLVFTIPVYGADHKFIILSSNDPVRATQAFEAAQEALMSGNAVTLFLVRDGARLASLWNPAHFKNEAGKNPLQIISRLIKDGAEVLICPRSMKDCHMNEYELIYGVERMASKDVIEKASMEKEKVARF